MKMNCKFKAVVLFRRIANPAERGTDKIVDKPEDYLFSSARNYAERESLLEVELIPHQLKTYV